MVQPVITQTGWA